MAGCSVRPGPQLLTKESSEGDCDSGQVFSVSMSWYSVPKGGGGKRAKRKKRSVFSGFPTYFLGLHNSILAFQWNG